METRHLPRLERGTLSEKAVTALLDHLQAHRLPPGTALPAEGRLAEQLGVSRPIIREALRTLKGLGVIEILNGRAAVVRRDLDGTPLRIYFARALQVLDDSLAELMEIRGSLESRAAALAARRHGPQDVAAMRDLVARMAPQLHDPAAYARLDTELHVAIARASGSRMLLQMIESLQAALEGQSERGMRRRPTEQSLQQVQAGHAELVERIAAGDAAGAARCMREHLQAATPYMRDRPG